MDPRESSTNPLICSNSISESSPKATLFSEYAILSLLSEFNYPQVRKDFADGLLGLALKYQVDLSDIDLICNTMLPS